MIHKEIGYNSGGYYVEFYDDSTEKRAYWYGHRSACFALKNSICLPELKWVDYVEGNYIDPFDLFLGNHFYVHISLFCPKG